MKKHVFTCFCCSFMFYAVAAQSLDTTKLGQPNDSDFRLPKYSGPYFPGCGEEKDKLSCSADEIVEFMSKNLTYLPTAVRDKVEGKVLGRFTIEKDGTPTKAEIVEDIGAGCGEEVLRVIRLIPRWEPGSARGRPVRITYKVTVLFTMADGRPACRVGAKQE
jgi:Gram-negative bacterial TonB protein C-terminal